MNKELRSSEPDYIIDNKDAGVHRIKKITIGILGGLVVTVVLSFIFAVLFSSTQISDELLPLFSYISLIIGAFSAGFFGLCLLKNNGLWNGLFTGLGLFFFQFILGIIVGKDTLFSLSTLLFLFIDVIFSVIGGILRVNVRR